MLSIWFRVTEDEKSTYPRVLTTGL